MLLAGLSSKSVSAYLVHLNSSFQDRTSFSAFDVLFVLGASKFWNHYYQFLIYPVHRRSDAGYRITFRSLLHAIIVSLLIWLGNSESTGTKALMVSLCYFWEDGIPHKKVEYLIHHILSVACILSCFSSYSHLRTNFIKWLFWAEWPNIIQNIGRLMKKGNFKIFPYVWAIHTVAFIVVRLILAPAYILPELRNHPHLGPVGALVSNIIFLIFYAGSGYWGLLQARFVYNWFFHSTAIAKIL